MYRDSEFGVWASAGAALALLAVAMGVVAALRLRRERRLLAQALANESKAREEAQQLVKARSALLGMVSHELRTPLSKVLAAAELIELVAPGDAVKEAVAELYAAAETMSLQLNDLSALSELSYPQASSHQADLDIRSALHGIVRTHAAMAQEHRNEVGVDVASDVPYRVALDPIRFGQIAANLISNAVKYTRDGKIDVTVRRSPDDNGQLELIVADTGKGIPPGEQDQVWEPFYRVRSATEPGTGLGLPIVRLAVTKLGGAVALESTLDEGTVFTVRLPLGS